MSDLRVLVRRPYALRRRVPGADARVRLRADGRPRAAGHGHRDVRLADLVVPDGSAGGAALARTLSGSGSGVRGFAAAGVTVLVAAALWQTLREPAAMLEAGRR